MGVAPWTLVEQPAYWLDYINAAMTAEINAAKSGDLRRKDKQR